MNDNSPETSQKPERVFKSGGVFASVFKREGAKGTFRVANLHRRYQDKQGQWQSSYQFTRSELAKVIDVAQQAEAYIKEKEAVEQPAEVKERQAA